MTEKFVDDVWSNLDLLMVENQVCECICICDTKATEAIYTCAKYWKFLCFSCTYQETSDHLTCDLIHCQDCDPEFSPQCNETDCLVCNGEI